MRNRTRSLGTLFTAVLLVGATVERPTPVLFEVPDGWPAITYDLKVNPLTQEGIALGRRLFYDPVLSADSSISCSSCHSSYTAFTHVDHPLSHGIGDRIGMRNAPALMNLAWSRSFMWDGAVHHLDMQALAPIAHEDEMGEDITHVVAKLQRSVTYPMLFEAAFGERTVTGEHLLKALAQFELTLVSQGSKYDRMKAGFPDGTFTEQETKGYALFQARCNGCHQEPLFTNGAFASHGLPVDPVLMDQGRMRITGDPRDSLLFKVPTLRNVEFSFPYMHDGRFQSLRDVLDHFAEDAWSSVSFSQEGRPEAKLSANEGTDLLAFLLTLSDKEFCFDPAHAYPREEAALNARRPIFSITPLPNTDPTDP